MFEASTLLAATAHMAIHAIGVLEARYCPPPLTTGRSLCCFVFVWFLFPWGLSLTKAAPTKAGWCPHGEWARHVVGASPVYTGHAWLVFLDL